MFLENQHLDMETNAFNVTADIAKAARFYWTATEGATADADAIIDGGDCSAEAAVTLEVEDENQALPACRNVTATPGGTAANIKAVRVKVIGTDINGDYQEEELPAFTADATTAVTGTKCFRRVKKVIVPAMDGAGVTVDIGFGNTYGLPFKFDRKHPCLATVDGTAKTVTMTVAEGAWTTVAFQTAPANKDAELIVFF